jgi:hypothetical protein
MKSFGERLKQRKMAVHSKPKGKKGQEKAKEKKRDEQHRFQCISFEGVWSSQDVSSSPRFQEVMSTPWSGYEMEQIGL